MNIKYKVVEIPEEAWRTDIHAEEVWQLMDEFPAALKKWSIFISIICSWLLGDRFYPSIDFYYSGYRNGDWMASSSGIYIFIFVCVGILLILKLAEMNAILNEVDV